MNKYQMLLILAMTSWSVLSQNGQKQTGVYLSRPVSVALVEGLIACDFAKKEVTILANTIDSKDVMIQDLKLQAQRSILEVGKRDDLIENYKIALQVAEERHSEMLEINRKERTRKKTNKYIYFGLGVVGGIVGYKQLKK